VRVALLTPTFWPEVHRGGERIVRETADGLGALGHTPRILTSHPAAPSSSVEGGVRVDRVWRPPDRRLRSRAWEEHLTHVPFAYGSLRRGDDDLAHAFYATDALAAARWARRTGKPAVFSYLGIPHRRGLANRRGRVEAVIAAAKGAETVTALSRTAAEGFRRWLGIEAEVVYPGVALDAFTPDPAQRSEKPIVICAADPGEPRKRVDLLVRALPAVRRGRPGTELHLVRPADAALARRLDAETGVRLFDPVQRPEDLAPRYRTAWVSALPSLGDSFGLVLAEALACGTPVVGTRDGAIPEVVSSGGIGRLFDGDDPASVAQALLEAIELAEDPATPERCQARGAEFGTDRQATAYAAIYRRAAATC